MDFKEIQELIKLINKSNLTEFKMEDGDFKLSIRTKKYGRQRNQVPPQQIVSVPAAPMQPVPQIMNAPVPQQPSTPQTKSDAAASDNQSQQEAAANESD